MRFFCSGLPRAALAAVLALALSACAVQNATPDSILLSGGGEISSDLGAALPDHPESSRTVEKEIAESEAPSFQELPSSETPSASSAVSSSSSSSEAASSESNSSSEASSEIPSSSEPGSSSQVSSSSQISSQAPPPSSSSQPDDKDDDPPDDDQDEDWMENDPVEGSSSEPEEVEPDDPEEDPEEDKPDHQIGNQGNSAWEDLKVRNNGSTISDNAVSIVSRMVQNEVNSNFPAEAIKAQAVAAYTFVRYHNTVVGDIPSVGMTSAASVSDRVAQLVREVAGEQITYNGRPILATYCAISAGTTASAQSVWGSSLPYLVPVDSQGDKSAGGYRSVTTMSANSVQSKLEKALNIDLDPVNPKDWFDIISYWDGGPYVNKVSIAGRKETTGRVIRESILGLRSAAFEVRFDRENDEFTFTTYGYGHGVGMSQMGAKYFAEQGWDHVEILEHYYSGTTVG